MDHKGTTMFKAQKGAKDIIKIIHVWHQWFNLNSVKLLEYFLCAKKNNFIQQFFNSLHCQSSTCVHDSGWTSDVTWTILSMYLVPFWALNLVVLLLSVGQKALRLHQKYLNLCSEDERRFYRFGTTWAWVINDKKIFWGELSFNITNNILISCIMLTTLMFCWLYYL